MPEDCADRANIDTLGNQPRCRRMSEVVKARRAELRHFSESRKRAGRGHRRYTFAELNGVNRRCNSQRRRRTECARRRNQGRDYA